MRIVRGITWRGAPPARVVAAVGVFDGIHRGHQQILHTAARRARAIGGTAVAVTFHPHPQTILHPKQAPPSLTSLAHRLMLMEQLGIQAALVIPFTRRFARLTPEAFCARVLAQGLRAREVVVGHNFCFGKERRGTATWLHQWGAARGMRVHVVAPVIVQGRAVSSSRIRRAILRGELARAAQLLGRPVSLRGRVVHGASRGASLGFPTANLALDHEAMPPCGVYAVTVRCLGRRWRGVANLGVRPTFERRATPLAEVHIFRFHRAIYDDWLDVQFLARLRSERVFPSREALARQIRRDIAQAHRLLRRP